MHECPHCYMACDCDGEDHWQDAPEDCACNCVLEDGQDQDYDDYSDPDDPPHLEYAAGFTVTPPVLPR